MILMNLGRDGTCSLRIFHMKLLAGLKDSPDRCVEEIKRIIDNYLEPIREVIE